MTQTARIIVNIGADGSISAETKGMEGAHCLDSISVLEDLLEAQTVSSAFTSEYYTTATSQEGGLSHDVEQR